MRAKRTPEKSHEYYVESIQNGKRREYWRRANARWNAMLADAPLLKRALTVRNNIRKEKIPISTDEAIFFVAAYDICCYCGKKLAYEEMSLDHMIPGLSLLENLHIICRDCNFRKGALTDGEYRDLLACLEFSEAAKTAFFKRVAAKGFHDKAKED